MRTRFGSIALLMVLGALFLCSCSDDDVVEPPIDVIPIIIPISEAQLMSNFRTAYEDRDVQTLTSLMHPDFLTVLQLPTIAQFPDLGPTLDRTEEIRIAQRMFSGSPTPAPPSST